MGHRKGRRVECAELAVHHGQKSTRYRYPHRDIESDREFKRERMLDTQYRGKQHDAVLQRKNADHFGNGAAAIYHEEQRAEDACEKYRDAGCAVVYKRGCDEYVRKSRARGKGDER